MRFRRAHSLVMSYYDQQIGLHNFVAQTRFSCNTDCLELLTKLDDWKSAEEIATQFEDVDSDSLSEQIYELVRLRAVVVEGTEQAAEDDKFRTTWQWGMAGGYLHFMTRDAEFPRDYTARNLAEFRKEWNQREPDYYRSYNAGESLLPLPPADADDALFSLMRRRRSNTHHVAEPIGLSALADCLYAGNGVIELRSREGGNPKPVTMTPSADACNPYELYAYANRVTGLKQGFYHYASVGHALAPGKLGEVDLPAMLGGQSWVANAAAIVFLVAHFPRSMWTFHKPIGYRLVTMEAGFIGQNICLAATHHGLSAVPVGSFSHSKLEPLLGVVEIESSLILAVCIGKAAA